MSVFSVTGSANAILRDMHRVNTRIQRRAEAATVNEVVRIVTKKTIKHVSKTKRIQQKFVKSRVKFYKKAKERGPIAYVDLLTLPLLVENMPHRVTKRKGVTAGVTKFPNGFQAKMRSGHVGVYQRRGKKRLPIDALKIPLEPLFTRTFNNYLRIESARMHKIFNRRMQQGLARR